MLLRVIMLTSLLCFSIILFGINRFFSSPVTIVLTAFISYFLSKKIRVNIGYKLKIIGGIKYFIFLLKEIFLSAINVVKIAWQPEMSLKPEMKWIKTKQKNTLSLVIYANSITLTPGTITVEANDNNLLIHALDKSSIQDLETGVMNQKVQNIVQ